MNFCETNNVYVEVLALNIELNYILTLAGLAKRKFWNFLKNSIPNDHFRIKNWVVHRKICFIAEHAEFSLVKPAEFSIAEHAEFSLIELAELSGLS